MQMVLLHADNIIMWRDLNGLPWLLMHGPLAAVAVYPSMRQAKTTV